MKRILVEFFDEDNLDNCISLLCEDYDEAVYFCFPDDRDGRRGASFDAAAAFVRSRTGRVPRFIPVEGKTAGHIYEAINRHLPEGEDFYDFDITGGSELYILAVGLAGGQRRCRNMSVHRYDVRTGRLVFSYPEKTVGRVRPLGTRELLSLFSSGISEGSGIADVSESAVLKYWEALKRIPHVWNRFAMQSQLFRDEDGRPAVLKRFSPGSDATDRVFAALSAAGLAEKIVEKNIDGKQYRGFTIDPSGNALGLYGKAGRLLELYTYYTAAATGSFYGCATGVELYRTGQTLPDLPGNEIDAVMSAGTYPVFLSCKNTLISNEALYEIKALSRFYGGKYAQPVIVSTVNESPGVEARAGALGIVIIGGCAGMERDEFGEKLSAIRKFAEENRESR